MSFSAIGNVYDRLSFREAVDALDISWASSVTIHHTASPSLAQRPKGWTIQHMRNLASYYGGELGWSRGPHLFTDEDQIFGLSPMTERSIHAVSFNKTSLSIEMLGNYDVEESMSGRGREVLETTAYAAAVLIKKLGKEATDSTIKFHRDDPKTSKTCPGRKVDKSYFLGVVIRYLKELDTLNDRNDAVEPKEKPTLEQRVAALEAKVFNTP